MVLIIVFQCLNSFNIVYLFIGIVINIIFDAMKKLEVYLCYRGTQKAIANNIKKYLEAYGLVNVYYDIDDVLPGDKLSDKLFNQLERSDYFLVLISRDIRESQWVRKEVNAAIQRETRLNRVFMIPILLPSVTESKIPSELSNYKKIKNIKLVDNEDIYYKLCCKQVHSALFSHMSQYLTAKINRPILNEIEGSKWENQTRRLADLNFKSLQRYYDSCKNYDSGTFFNVQISSDEWFEPNLQLHLAIQESMADRIRWSYNPLIEMKDVDNYMPFKRVSFIAKTRDELIKDFQNGEASARHLCTLMHIHNLMACPLAIVTVDRFADIISKNKGFFINNNVEKVLGIPRAIIATINKKDSTAKWFLKLVGELKEIIDKQANDFPGIIKPSMDFAIFKKNTKKSIWGGKVAEDGALTYYKIGAGDDKRWYENNYPPRLKKIEFHYQGVTSADSCECIKKFVDIIESNVFHSMDVNDNLNDDLLSYVKKFIDVNPLVAKLKKNKIQLNYNHLFKVKIDYCPWSMLHDYSKTAIAPHRNMPGL